MIDEFSCGLIPKSSSFRVFPLSSPVSLPFFFFFFFSTCLFLFLYLSSSTASILLLVLVTSTFGYLLMLEVLKYSIYPTLVILSSDNVFYVIVFLYKSSHIRKTLIFVIVVAKDPIHLDSYRFSYEKKCSVKMGFIS